MKEFWCYVGLFILLTLVGVATLSFIAGWLYALHQMGYPS